MAKGAISRVADIIRADIHDMIGRMEDPEKMVRQMILDMEDAVSEAAAAVTQAMANERVLGKRISGREELGKNWASKAEQAVAAGEEELARKALEQRVAVASEVEEMQASLSEAEKVTAELKQQLVRFKAKLAEARASQKTLVLQRKAVERRKAMAGERPRVREDAFARFDEFCNQVTREEAEATVYEDVAGTKPALDSAFDKLEIKRKVDAELQALKEKLSSDEKKG